LFCPQCKLEYRPGFTHCPDCDVDLVAALPQGDGSRSSQAAARDLRSPVILRQGVRGADALIIRDVLSGAGVVFNERRAAAEIVADGLPTYEFWVNAEDRPNALSLIAPALGEAESDESADSLEVLWGGNDSEFFDQLCAALLKNGIDCYKYEAESQRLPSAFSRNPYEVSVRPEDFAKAADVLESVNDDAAINKQGAPPAHLAADAAPEDEVDDVPIDDDLGDDERTAEAWSGATQDQAEALKFCLREVGITCRVVSANGRTRLLVAPKVLDRAKEVVREVVEGAQSE